MSRRASLPGAAELFRATGPGDDVYDTSLTSGDGTVRAVPDLPGDEVRSAPVPAAPGTAERPRTGVRQTTPRRRRNDDRRPSGRERHEEKITVYVSGDELFDLEQARLVLRGRTDSPSTAGASCARPWPWSSPTSTPRASRASWSAGCARADRRRAVGGPSHLAARPRPRAPEVGDRLRPRLR